MPSAKQLRRQCERQLERLVDVLKEFSFRSAAMAREIISLRRAIWCMGERALPIGNYNPEMVKLICNDVAEAYGRLRACLRECEKERDRWYAEASRRGAVAWEWYLAASLPPVDTPLIMRLVYQTRASEAPSNAVTMEVEYMACQIDGETSDLLTPCGDDVGWKYEDVVTHWAPIVKPPKEQL